jgi:class 3 adenylate cyclase
LDRWPDPTGVSLGGYYSIGAAATLLGIMIVFLLNMATPLSFVHQQLAAVAQRDAYHAVLLLSKRFLGLLMLIVLSCVLLLLVMRRILRPVSACLSLFRSGKTPRGALLEKARRRLLNFPFILIGVNVAIWILMPALLFLTARTMELLDTHTATVFSLRATMVGFVASGISFFGIESHARRRLIPYFFPEGRLVRLKGVARISVSRRIRMFFRLGSVVPGAILILTLLTVQLEVHAKGLTAAEYGRGIILFTLVLGGIFFITSGVLNRMVARSIVMPLDYMLAPVERIRDGDYTARIQVITNDEIGMLGDAGNEMIAGLREREKIRSAFGRYVTPEIRDEIMAGRIPLNGERREATVLFADLRAFTPFVENHPPEEVIASMRAYFTAMHRAIRQHRGLVLQFVGDEIEAVFGVPVPFADHADAAVQAALAMRVELERLNQERTGRGKSPFAHGIGIHSGSVLAGNTGSEEQSAYALIGETVNVASRIQELTKSLDCDILASEQTVTRLSGAYPCDPEPPRRVQGYSKSIVVFRVGDRAPSAQRLSPKGDEP